ncbi:MAG TPA: hypothetical protein DCS30_00925, partial [Rhizobiales bacterium]|nr:hypothetical protein [Hyphomicrobiales bacterium]
LPGTPIRSLRDFEFPHYISACFSAIFQQLREIQVVCFSPIFLVKTPIEDILLSTDRKFLLKVPSPVQW